MFILTMEDMRGSAVKGKGPIAKAESKKELLEFIKRERTNQYTDDKWVKSFKKNGPLEWYNYNSKKIVNMGTLQDWVNSTIEHHNRLSERFPDIPKEISNIFYTFDHTLF